MRPLVSILIPAYNAEKVIKDTINSALAQTWPNKEIIIVDDGSTDNTLSIAREFEFKSLKVITQSNRGACNARNRAFDVCQGDFIQWLDADDLLAPDKITLQLTNEDHSSNTKVLYSSAWGWFYFCPQKAKFNPSPLWQDLSPISWLTKSFGGIYWVPPLVFLVSRMLTDLAGPWDERLTLNQDGEYFCRVVGASELVKFVPKAHCYHRRMKGSISSHRSSNNALESWGLSTNLCIDHFLALENSETTRKACINLLQNLISKSYSAEPGIINILEKRIIALGGTLAPPTETWKFFLIRKVLGLKTAMFLKKWLGHVNILVRTNLEKLLATLY